jgi:hypothetical protein
MADSRFGALRELRREPPAPVSMEPLQAPVEKADMSAPKVVASPARAPGKSRSQEFERLTIYVRKDTKKAATRKWEDATGRDMSELVEHLLFEYLNV